MTAATSSLYAALSSGDLRSIKIGTRRLIKIEAIREWLMRNELAGEGPAMPKQARLRGIKSFRCHTIEEAEMSKQPNEKNERLKRRFLEYRKHARQLSEASLDRDAAALERLDVWNRRKDLERFRIQQAMDFRAHLEKAKGATGRPLGKSTMKAILAILRELILWLSQQEGFRRRMPTISSYPDATRPWLVQHLREVQTKFGKHIDTFFARGFEEAEAALAGWLKYLEDELLFGPDDPLFPATAVSAKSNTGFAPDGFERRCWKSSEPVRKIVRSALEVAGLPNYGPHAFRHMLARHAAKTSKSVAELVANSQNLGHTDVLTTLRSYGQIDRDRQRQLVTGLIEDEDGTAETALPAACASRRRTWEHMWEQ